MKRTKVVVRDIPMGRVFYVPDLLDGERRMTFYRRIDEGDAMFAGVCRLGLMQFHEHGAKRVNLRVSEAGSSGFVDVRMPAVMLG